MAAICAACFAGRHDQCGAQVGVANITCGCGVCFPERLKTRPETNPERMVEHHWHEPGRGQVMKALLQHLHDMGFTKEHLQMLVETKVESVVRDKVYSLLESGKLNDLVVNAVAVVALGNKKLYEPGTGNGYGWYNKIRSMTEEKVKEICTNEYEVIIRKKEKPNAG